MKVSLIWFMLGLLLITQVTAVCWDYDHQPPLLDTDCDGVPDISDNCDYVYNPGQEDNNGYMDGDGVGDACEDVPPNEPPVWSSFSLPALSCGGSFEIDVKPYVSDDRDSDAQLILAAESTNPNIVVTRVSHGVFRIRHAGGEDASATIRFRAVDTGGESATSSKNVAVDCPEPPVNEPPVWSSFTLPGLACDGQFDFDVKPYVSDDRDSDAQLILTAESTNPNIVVTRVSHGVFRIRHAGGEDSDARITFTAVDTQGESASVNKYVVVDCPEPPVNAPPVWSPFSLPQVSCNGYVQKDIRPYVSDDRDSDAQLILTAQSDNPGIVVTRVSHGVFKVRHVSGVDESATVTFTATDTGDLSSSTSKSVVVDCVEPPVNEPPVWIPFTLPDVSCNAYRDIDIKPYVSDDHDSDYALRFYAESSNPNIRVSHQNHGVFRIRHLGGADVSGTITFTAEDTGGLRSSVGKAIIVDCPDENHPPRFVIEVSPQTVSCNQEFSPIPLRDMVEDPDQGDTLTFSVQGADDIPVDIRNGIAYLANPHRDVVDTITFIVTDGQLSDSSTATFRVQGCEEPPVNAPPVWAPFTLPRLACQGSFEIDIRPYVSDDHDSDAQLIFTAESSNPQVSVVQVSHGVFRVRHVSGDHVSSQITFRARDTGGLTSSVVATVVVDCEVPPNSPPVVNVPPIYLACSETRPLDLARYAHDPDGDALTFTVTEYDPNSVINLLRNPFRVQSLGAGGVGYLDVRVSDGVNPPVNQRVMVTVTCGPEQNHPPQFAQIPSQRISCNGEFTAFDLDNYAQDPDGDPLTYSYSGNDRIGVLIRPDGFVTLLNPQRNVREYITFSARDPRGLVDYSTATFEVYGCEDEGAMIELDIPDQSVCHGDRFDVLDLDDYVDYGEGDLDFSVSGDDDLDVHIDGRNRLEVDYPEGFFGSETLRFRVEDEDGNVDRQDVRFRVKDCGYGIPPPIVPGPFVPTIRFVEFKPAPEPNTQCLIQDRLTGKTYPDFDCDDVPDDRDNCPDIPNTNQKDVNKNGVGDACDLILSYFEVVPDWVRAGESFTVKAGLRNKFGYDLEDVKLTLRVEGMGITQAKNIPSLISGETEDVDFLVDIPECAEEKTYTVKLTMDSRSRDVVIATGKIKVVEGKCFAENRNVNIVDMYTIQDVPAGGSAIYPLKITNTDSYAKSYTMRLVGIDGWGSFSFDTGSVVIVPPYTEVTVNAYVYANNDAPSGEKTFMAEIRHANEVEQVILGASVKSDEKSDLVLSIRILQVVLGILIVAGIVVGIAYLVAQHRAKMQAGRSYT